MFTPRKIDFRDFPNDARFPQIEGKLFMADNLDDDQEHREPTIKMESPVQLGMTVILMCIEGHMQLTINLNQYELKTRMVSTLLSGSFMQITSISPDFRGSVIAIANDFMNFTEDIKMGMAIHRHTAEMPCFAMTKESLEETLELYRLMKRKLSNRDFYYREQVARAYLDLFKYNGFQEFYLRGQIEGEGATRSRKDELVKHFVHEVQEHYRQQRQVIYYADRLCISPKYLSAVVHDVSGRYATEWIDQYVILDAKTMLKNTQLTIKEICSQLNFANQSMFAKYFKQHTGMTPKQYRNN